MENIKGIVTHIFPPKPGTNRVFAEIRYESPSGMTQAKFGANASRLEVGDYFSADGAWVSNSYKGRVEEVFNAKVVRPDLPQSPDAVVRWFVTLFDRTKHGVTPELVRAFVGKHGPKAAVLCERDPKLLHAITMDPQAFGPEMLKEWARRISGRRAVRLLEDSGVEQRAIASLLEAYRDSAFSVLQANPYTAARVPDFGFSNADKVGIKSGIEVTDARRVTAAMYEAVNAAREEGHTYVTLQELTDKLGAAYGIGRTVVEQQALAVIKGKDPLLVIDRKGDRIVAMAREMFVGEAFIARATIAMLQNGSDVSEAKADAVLEDVFRVPSFARFDEVQRSAVKMAITNSLSILTGGPGTGKSTVMEAIVQATEAMGHTYIELCAPTGKAAQRLEEAAKRPAMTIHRLLEAREDKRTGGSVFGRNKTNKLPAGITVGFDEVSMSDVVAMRALLEAMPADGRMIFVGDKNQLRSVDAGAVLADMLGAEIDGVPIIPRTELINVYRQTRDSRIALGAAEIREGKVPFMTNTNDGGLAFFEHRAEEIVERVKWVVKEVFVGMARLKPNQFSVLVPQAPGLAGAWQINRELSAMLNPSGKAIPGVVRGPNDNPAMPIPRVGDRIMLTENDSENDVMNGDVGTIVAAYGKAREGGVERPFIKIAFDCGKEVEYPASSWRQLILGYAITVHKSQGSQYQAVVMPIATAHQNMLDRSIVYTGWTRAKTLLVLVGERDAMQAAVENVGVRRNTRLDEYLVAAAREAGYKPKTAIKPTAAPRPTALEASEAPATVMVARGLGLRRMGAPRPATLDPEAPEPAPSPAFR